MSLAIQAGEYGIVLELTVYDHGGSVHSFVGTESVQAYVVKGGGESVAFGNSVVSDASNGVLQVTVQSADVAILTQGTYELRVKISGASSTLIPEPAELSVGRGVA